MIRSSEPAGVPKKHLVDMSNEELMLYSMSICLTIIATALLEGPTATDHTKQQGVLVLAAARECRSRA